MKTNYYCCYLQHYCWSYLKIRMAASCFLPRLYLQWNYSRMLRNCYCHY